MKSKKEIVLSFAIYGLGLTAMIIADIYVSVYFDKVNVAEWAFVKSCILIIGTFCLLGYDQVFVRDPSLIKRVFNKFLLQSFIISSIATFIIAYVKEYTVIYALFIFGCIFLFSFLSYFASASRANFNLWKAQFSTNFWKFLLVIFIIIFHEDNVILSFFVTLSCATIISFLLKGFYVKDDNQNSREFMDGVSARKIGLAFLIHNITLILAIYGEQFLINLNDDIITSEHLFKYVAIFTPIALSINGFLGFYFGPKIRKENNMTLKSYIGFSKKIFAMSIVTTVLSIFMGFLFMIFYSKVEFHKLDLLLILSLSIMCLVRGFYTSTSVCLGIFGSSSILQRSATYSFVITIIYILSIVVILYLESGIVAAQLISFASLGNWLSRFFISNSFTIKTLKSLQNVN